MATRERKQGAFSVGYHRKKEGITEKQGGHWVWDQKKMCLFWCELPKIGSYSV